MNLRDILTVFTKELRDTLRDRRAIISMFIVPTIVMPLVVLGFGFVSVKVIKKAEREIAPIMLLGGEDSPRLRAVLENSPRLKIIPPSADYADQISQKKLRAAVAIPDGFDDTLDRDARAKLTIYTHDGEIRSGLATRALEQELRNYREKIVRERLAARGLPPAFVQPFSIDRENVAPPEKVGGSAFGGLVPYLMIILCFVGAMYTAVDLTAGEKERGTMETLLCSPVARIDLVLGKFLVVLSSSLATVASSIASMTLSALIFGFGKLQGIASAGIGEVAPTISIPGVLGVVILVIPLAVLFSALIMTVALFAKTHKEAQTYVSPLLILVILPAVAAVLPGIELTTTLSLIPILNIALASKEMVAGSFPILSLALIFLSTCVYAALALAVTVRMFNREDVIFRA
jgi:sodium transport system permease protein